MQNNYGKLKRFVFLFVLTIISINAFCGPPFFTDDPEPVDLKHWEFYISSMEEFQSGMASGTFPHFETNYGIIDNMQLHFLAPLNYNYINESRKAKFGYAYTEVGIKYRFIKESDGVPQMGTFPILEIPTIKNSTFSNNKIQLFLPLWIQKSWGDLTTYGGGGYWLNPGDKNWLYAGWLVQYDFSKILTLGGEMYYHTPASSGETSVFALNAGGLINFSSKFHFLFSVGSSFNSISYTSYFGILWTI